MREYSLGHVKPAVWPPCETIQQFMAVIEAKSSFYDSPFIGYIVTVGIFKEKQIGRLSDVDAAVAERDSCGQIQSINEDGDLVGFSVSVGIFEDLHAVTGLLALGRAQGILIEL